MRLSEQFRTIDNKFLPHYVIKDVGGNVTLTQIAYEISRAK